jgi:hypothetical protein
MRKLAFYALLLASVAGHASAHPCAIGVANDATSTPYLDANGNGRWDGVAGGDERWSFVSWLPGQLFVGDWNGDGVDDPAKLVGTYLFLDQNGNHRWDGPVGGDYKGSYSQDEIAVTAPPQGVPLAGHLRGEAADQPGRYSTSFDRFYLDTTGDDHYANSGVDTLSTFGTQSHRLRRR